MFSSQISGVKKHVYLGHFRDTVEYRETFFYNCLGVKNIVLVLVDAKFRI